MPTALPSIASFTDPGVTQGGFKTSLTNMRQYLADLLNTTGDPQDAFLRIWGIGEVKLFAYDFAAVDDGTVKIVEADGQAYSRSTYAAGFTRLGVIHGPGDGSTTYNVPNSRERSWVGSGAAFLDFTFQPADINTTTNVITVPSNESLYTGTPVLYTRVGTAAAPLVDSTIYYWIKLSATTGKLASTLALAQNYAGTGEIDLTTQGVGAQKVTISYTTRTVGSVFGQEAHAQAIAELLAHVHLIGDIIQRDGADQAFDYLSQSANANDGLWSTRNTDSKGGNTAMNVLSPSIVGKYMIRIK